MNTVLLGNIVAFIGSIGSVLLGLSKDKKKTIFFQIIVYCVFCVANFILGGTSGLITNAISIVRNIVCLKHEFTWQLKVVFMGLQGILIAIFNTEGLSALYPFIAVLIFVAYIDAGIVKFKSSISVAQIFWIMYDLSILNISSCVFDVLTLITNTYTLIQIVRHQNREAL